jgi:hypothetical protein
MYISIRPAFPTIHEQILYSITNSSFRFFEMSSHVKRNRSPPMSDTALIPLFMSLTELWNDLKNCEISLLWKDRLIQILNALAPLWIRGGSTSLQSLAEQTAATSPETFFERPIQAPLHYFPLATTFPFSLRMCSRSPTPRCQVTTLNSCLLLNEVPMLCHPLRQPVGIPRCRFSVLVFVRTETRT